MKKITFLSFVFASLTMVAQTPCSGGFAGSYPCDGYNLMAHISLAQMGASGGNDSWGWTDPVGGKEYAIMGLNNGTAFIDISNPTNPIYLGKLPTHSEPSIWRDIKVYNNYAFIVSEANNHGMQVFDLTRLRNVTNPPQTFTEDAHVGFFGSAHNIAINEETGFAYIVGTIIANGGPLFLDLQDPLDPIWEGEYAGSAYTHDAQIIVYDGPDTDYTGREIFFGSNANEVVIVDVTDKLNPQLIKSITYANTAYTHQGWLTEDRNYFIVGDEIDESTFGFNTRTIVMDVSDLDNAHFYFDYYGNIPSIDHNGYVVGDKFYLANYTGGLRILDISDIENQNISEEGYFDTFPANNSVSYDATWSVYPFFGSGNIVISGEEGFTLVRDANLGTYESSLPTFSLSPNPAKESITLVSSSDPIQKISIKALTGQTLLKQSFPENEIQNINISQLSSGVYLVIINDNTTMRLLVN
ncbi:MAG: choice-of-anchor B family protein [Flavobacteriaceae bacterium]